MPTLFAAAGGTAFRFDLPTLSAPAPGGKRCEVEVTFVADSHAQLLATDGPLCQSLLGPHELFGSLPMTRLVVGDTLWLLSGLQKTSKVEPTKIIVEAERWQLSPSEAARSAARIQPTPASQMRVKRQASAQQQRRWEWSDPAAYKVRSLRPPLQGYAPLSSRTSNDPDTVANFPVYGGRWRSQFKENYDDLTIEHELPINEAISGPINFMRYVDYLPISDAFSPNAKIIDRRLAPNSLWSVSQAMQTYFKATRLDPGLRTYTWHLLTTPDMGLPCFVKSGEEICYNVAGLEGSVDFPSNSSIKKGKAVMKLVPIGDDYACQPQSAFPEASYLFNNWRVIVEQDGRQEDLFHPRAHIYEARDSLDMDGPFIEQLAEIASAEKAPGHIIYAKMPYSSGEESSGVGVRLRDGGSRFSLTEGCQGLGFSVPGSTRLHSKWGRFEEARQQERAVNAIHAGHVKVRVAVPEGEHDIILRVNESHGGDYNRLEYALRPRNSFKPIKSNEWLPVTTDVVDEWVICFFINLAKVSWGCFNRDLVRPSAASATVSPAPASGSLLSSPSSSSTSSLYSSSRESKKPRIL